VAAAVRLIERHKTARLDNVVRSPDSRAGLPNPGDPQVLLAQLNAALAEHHGGALQRALEGYRRVLEIEPLQPEALHLQGIALAQLGRNDAALDCLSLLLRLEPQNAAAHNHHGNALAGLARTEEALQSYERALELDPQFVDALYNRGCMLATLGRHPDAVGSYEAALALDPRHARAHNNLGSALHELGQYSAALAHQEDAVRLDSDCIDARVNAANTLRRLGRYSEALAYTERALESQPGRAQAHSGHGATLAALGRYEEALQHYRRALELDPSLAEATWNEGLALLSRGELREGWTRYEARWRVKSLNLTSYCNDQAPWLGGESLEGKVILLHAEQGYGDSIQFCRYAPLVTAQGARVVLGVPGALRKLMLTLDGVAEVVAQTPLPEFDCHCPLLSLPMALGTRLDNIPATIPYLRGDPAAREVWNGRLGRRVAPRVGLVWSGRPTHTNDANRSVALRDLLPLTGFEAQWVSLQKDIRLGDVPAITSMRDLRRFGEELTDFADAAALLSELDLLITVDTAMAHLAGALGIPVWILLPHVADWRWLQEREDSPWYPTARLFRQRQAGDWGSVIQRVAGELGSFIGGSAVATGVYGFAEGALPKRA
jgi:tetratricopeptide (TPR) repeat protein